MFLQRALDNACAHNIPLHVGMAEVAKGVLAQKRSLTSFDSSASSKELAAELAQHESQISVMSADAPGQQHEEYRGAVNALDHLGTPS